MLLVWKGWILQYDSDYVVIVNHAALATLVPGRVFVWLVFYLFCLVKGGGGIKFQLWLDQFLQWSAKRFTAEAIYSRQVLQQNKTFAQFIFILIKNALKNQCNYYHIFNQYIVLLN